MTASEDARKVVVAVVYADQFGAWDARNIDNEVVAVGGGTPMPLVGETVDEWIDRRARLAALEA